ncbi:hypothetical protein [Pantoea sp. VH_24]|uniref:hypothetical protein n=1 Tax=unclassified Pantoea TaxID=2630326 RepID=UPI00351BABF8
MRNVIEGGNSDYALQKIAYKPRLGSEEDKAYYVAVFCAIDHHGQQPFDQQMRNVIEGGNSDYALQKIAYKPRLGRSVIGRWEQLTNDEQQRATQDNMVCQQLLKR